MSRERGLPAAVKHRLLQVARLRNEEFEQLLVRYVAERFLYRLSVSRFADAFLLKGAMLLIAWQGSPHRVTRDVDLLGLGECSTPGVSKMLGEVALARPYDDGVAYDVGSLETQTIRALSGASGVRVTL
ncbi:MAG: nucleotidyl transferase AbiEii/AbiGii toxin family protein [Phycisphaerales bacterium]|nr:nucleotidyl transferase AbiEii/AbiGii toxin family protein [Phycisphaerales bacterium]